MSERRGTFVPTIRNEVQKCYLALFHSYYFYRWSSKLQYWEYNKAEPRIKKHHREELDGLWLHGVFQEDIFRPSQVLVELHGIWIKTLLRNNATWSQLDLHRLCIGTMPQHLKAIGPRLEPVKRSIHLGSKRSALRSLFRWIYRHVSCRLTCVICWRLVHAAWQWMEHQPQSFAFLLPSLLGRINLYKFFQPLHFLRFTYSFPSVQSALAFQGAF